MQPSYFKYWGKSGANPHDTKDYHLLVYHSLDVAAVGLQLLNQHPSYLDHFQRMSRIGKTALQNWLPFLLALHDIGKFADSFQNLNPTVRVQLNSPVSDRIYGLRHDSLGWMLWKQHLRQKFAEEGWISLPVGSKRRASIAQPVDFWLAAVVGHHGQPPCASSTGLARDYFEEQLDFEAAGTFAQDLFPLFLGEPEIFPECSVETAKLASWWLSGFAVLCDWLGSNTQFFRYQSEVEPLSDYWQTAQHQALNAVQETELFHKRPSTTLEVFDLLGGIPQPTCELTPLQQEISSWNLTKSPQIFILEDVTGAGKTEAAVLLAHHLMKIGLGGSLYFGLPTMATANSMYERMRKVYRKLFEIEAKPSLVLAHGSAEMSELFQCSIVGNYATQQGEYAIGELSAEAHCNAWLADNRKKTLLADIGVGTIDQALMAVLPSRHQSLRLLGLIDKILLVDEVHACDDYMHELLCALLQAHAAAGGSAILLSATLPHHQRQAFLNAYADGQNLAKVDLLSTTSDSYPLISCLDGNGLREQIIDTRDSVKREVTTVFLQEQQAVDSVLAEAIAQGQCACWIRNTVKDAVETYQRLTQWYPEWQVDLFHARFALHDRIEIENRVVQRFSKNSGSTERRGQILIATQVVEQSLDLDFDTLISDLAPIDLLIQRAGRLRRHTRDSKGNRTAQADQRGPVRLHLYSPEPTTTPTAGWYTNFFPNASRVYEHHGQLWLTAHQLQSSGSFRMPDDARSLIEGVYGLEAQEGIPEGLLQQSIEAEGGSRANASLARMNRLKLELGYHDTETNRWWDEAKTPTRLGEATTTVYLAKWLNGELSPWAKDGQHAWPLSAVTMRTHWITAESPTPELSKESIEDFKSEQLPAKGRWGVLLPLSLHADNQWRGSAMNANQETISFLYNSRLGLVNTSDL